MATIHLDLQHCNNVASVKTGVVVELLRNHINISAYIPLYSNNKFSFNKQFYL